MTLETNVRYAATETMAGPVANRYFAGLSPRERLAHHEAAHAVVTLFNDVRPVYSVSIVSDGDSAGRVRHVAPSAPSSSGTQMNPFPDRRLAAEILSWSFPGWRQTLREMRCAKWRAETLVKCHVAEIQAVAAALLERGELSGAEAAWIAWDARPWKPKVVA
jgi:hypothetical protein